MKNNWINRSVVMLALLLFGLLYAPFSFAAGRLSGAKNPVTQVWRQHNDITKHYFSLSAGGGYYAFLENIKAVKTTGGGGGLFGVGYELRYKGFFLSTGVDFLYGVSNMNLSPFKAHSELYDTQGKKVSFHYDVTKYREAQHDFRLGIPLMLGYYSNGVYFGVGAKFSYALHTVGVPVITYTTTGTYDRYITDFEHMPNHFYTKYVTKSSDKLRMLPQGSVIAELGYDILNKERNSSYALCSVLKIALYAEYGINRAIRGAEHNELNYGVNTSDPSQLTVDSYYTCKDLKKSRVSPFYIGMKMVFMLRIKTKDCKCYGPL